MINLNDPKTESLLKLTALIKELNLKGHNIATSGNYSLKFSDQIDRAYISESGIDKSQFCVTNLFEIYMDSFLPVLDENKGRKPSDETAIHMMIYKIIGSGCVLHSHFIESLLIAEMYPHKDIITLSDLEMIKAFKGIKSHQDSINVLLVPNTQEIKELSIKMEKVITNTSNCFALILRGHGVYVWGETVDSAKRHLEALQYIFQFIIRKKEIL